MAVVAGTSSAKPGSKHLHAGQESGGNPGVPGCPVLPLLTARP